MKPLISFNYKSYLNRINKYEMHDVNEAIKNTIKEIQPRIELDKLRYVYVMVMYDVMNRKYIVKIDSTDDITHEVRQHQMHAEKYRPLLHLTFACVYELSDNFDLCKPMMKSSSSVMFIKPSCGHMEESSCIQSHDNDHVQYINTTVDDFIRTLRDICVKNGLINHNNSESIFGFNTTGMCSPCSPCSPCSSYMKVIPRSSPSQLSQLPLLPSHVTRMKLSPHSSCMQISPFVSDNIYVTSHITSISEYTSISKTLKNILTRLNFKPYKIDYIIGMLQKQMFT